MTLVEYGQECHPRSEEHTSELQSRPHLVCRLLLEKKNSARSQVDLLGEGRPRSKEESTCDTEDSLQVHFAEVGLHCSSPQLVGLVNDEFPGIDQHHHQHSTRENVVGCDLALIVGVFFFC